MALKERTARIAAVIAAAGIVTVPGALATEHGAAGSPVRGLSTDSGRSPDNPVMLNCELPGMNGKKIAVTALPRTESTGFAKVVKVTADRNHEAVAQSPSAIVDIATPNAQRTFHGADVMRFAGPATVQVRAGTEVFRCIAGPQQADRVFLGDVRRIQRTGPLTGAQVGPNGIRTKNFPRRSK
jgi:hypothetical protein